MTVNVDIVAANHVAPNPQITGSLVNQEVVVKARFCALNSLSDRGLSVVVPSDLLAVEEVAA